MINAIIKGIFWVITRLFTLILTPFISLITSAFPDISTALGYMSSFFGYGFTYLRAIVHLLLIPDSLLIFVFDYIVICNTIFYSILAVRFAIKVYNKLKI